MRLSQLMKAKDAYSKLHENVFKCIALVLGLDNTGGVDHSGIWRPVAVSNDPGGHTAVHTLQILEAKVMNRLTDQQTREDQQQTDRQTGGQTQRLHGRQAGTQTVTGGHMQLTNRPVITYVHIRQSGWCTKQHMRTETDREKVCRAFGMGSYGTSG